MKKILAIAAVSAVSVALAGDFDGGPQGFRFGPHFKVMPSVQLSYTFDTNPYSSHKSEDESCITIGPLLTFEYMEEQWSLIGAAFYQYHEYLGNGTDGLDKDSYGQKFDFNYSNVVDDRGWSFLVNEKYSKIAQNDDIARTGGRGRGRDRSEFQFTGGAIRRCNCFHIGVNAGYYWLDYDNNRDKWGALYGWNRWQVGGEVGWVLSKWTDVFVAGSYQGYEQDNCHNRGDYAGTYKGSLSSDSEGETVHVGMGSYMTERIRYRLSGGWSKFEYSNSSSDDGFTYQGSFQWTINERLAFSAMASSYYTPSEQEYGSSLRNDQLSVGLNHRLIDGRLTANYDIQYRREENQSHISDYYASDYSRDIIVGRIGLNYILNRYCTFFSTIECQEELNDTEGNCTGASDWDYDRFRLTIGARLTY